MEPIIGNAFCVQVIAFLFGSRLAQAGALAAAAPGQLCLATGARKANWNASPDFQRPGRRDQVLERPLIVEL